MSDRIKCKLEIEKTVKDVITNVINKNASKLKFKYSLSGNSIVSNATNFSDVISDIKYLSNIINKAIPETAIYRDFLKLNTSTQTPILTIYVPDQYVNDQLVKLQEQKANEELLQLYKDDVKNKTEGNYDVIDGEVVVFPLKKVEEQSKITQEKFKEGEKNYVFSDKITISEQEAVINQLTGYLLFKANSNLLEGKSVEFYKTSESGKKTLIAFAPLYSLGRLLLKKENKTDLEQRELEILREILKPETSVLFEKAILSNLKQKGYKLTQNGDVKLKLEGLETEVNELENTTLNSEDTNEQIEEKESQDGKTDQISDYSALTTRMKDTMSSHLRTFLSSIQSTQKGLIGLNLTPNLFVEEDVVIQAINEATLGWATLDDMIVALDSYSQLKGREFLKEVSNKIKDEKAKGSKIANEFGVKFNQQYNKLVLVKYSKTPLALFYKKSKTGNVYPQPYIKDGEITPNFNFEVIDVNRNTLWKNIQNQWIENFYELYDTVDSVVLDENKEEILKLYKQFSTDSNKTNLSTRLTNLLEAIGIELSQEAVNRLVTSNYQNPQYFVPVTEANSIFNTKYGILGTLFQEFTKEKPDVDAIFGTSGLLRIARIEALFTEQYLNTSTLDGKGRNIWSYGLPNPTTRELNKIIKSPEYLNDILNTYYSQGSFIGRSLKSIQDKPELKAQFLDRLNMSLFNVIKSDYTSGKELKHTNDREFILSKIGLITGTSINPEKGERWSYKFVTTPSDKSTMWMMQTPDHKIDVSISLDNNNISVREETINRYYDYFKAEYYRVNSYITGTEEYKQQLDKLGNYIPQIFYHFPQFNLKSSPIWNKENGTLTLNPLSTVEEYVKSELKKQIEKNIQNTYSQFEQLGFIEDDKMITGIPDNYLKTIPSSISKIENLNLTREALTNLSFEELEPELYEKLDTTLRQSTKYLVADYAINYELHNIEMQMLLLGDPTQFAKNENTKKKLEVIYYSNDVSKWVEFIDDIRDNLSKKMAGIGASGAEGQFGKNATVNYLQIEDPSFQSKILSEISAINKTLSTKFENIDFADGGEIITAEEDLLDKLAYGKISQSQYKSFSDKLKLQNEDLAKQGFVSEENKFTKEENLIAQPQKPVVFANILDKNLKIRKVTYYKSAAFALYPEFTQGFEIDKLREFAYNLSKKNIRVDRFPMKTATKLGLKSPLKNLFVQDSQGAIRLDEEAFNSFDQSNIDIVPRDYFRIQLEVPFDAEKDQIRIGSQQVKLIFSEILDLNFEGKSLNHFLPEFSGKIVTGKDLKDLHDKTFKQLITLSKDEFIDEIGINPETFQFTDLTKLQAVLLKQAEEQGYDKVTMEGLKLTSDGTEFSIPLAFSANKERFEKLLLSLIRNIIIQKIHGRSFILISEGGFVPKTNIQEGKQGQEFLEQNKTNLVSTSKFNPKTGLLPARIENGVFKPAQVFVTWKFKDNNENPLDINDFLNEDGTLDESKVSEDVLRILGFRIPTQGHPSMSSIEIVGFIPEFMGDTIVAPQDFTKQFGSDFDIDKLYGYMYNYKLSKKDGLIKFTEDFKEESDLISTVFNTQLDKEKLQNKLIDIYHTIMQHPYVHEKSLEGITEGNLATLKKELSKFQQKLSPEYYSPSSDILKVEEYFENKSGKLGVGIFSIANTMASVIEGKEITLATLEKTEEGYELVDNPFLIKSEDNKVKELKEFSSGEGVNTLISIYQSASVDNAKLKYLKAIHENEETMGVTAVLAFLANKSTPELNEDYITYFLSQPIIIEYVTQLQKGSDEVKRNKNRDWKQIAVQEIRDNYIEQLKSITTEEEFNNLNSLPYQGFSLSELKTFVEKPQSPDFISAQLQILDKFLYLKSIGDDVRTIQYLINADSKGTPNSLDEAYFKIERKKNFLDSVSTLKNVETIFVENNTQTLQDYLFGIANHLPINLYSQGIKPILPTASTKVTDAISIIRNLSRGAEVEQYNEELGISVTKALVSYLQATDKLSIADGSIIQEKINLLYDYEENKSLATEVEEFKKTDLFKESTLLKPLFSSLKPVTKRNVKKNKLQEDLKFLEFKGSTGLTSPDEQIAKALNYLRLINYPLFERLIKYQFLIQGNQSPVNLRKYIPVYYLEAVGIAQDFRGLNQKFNNSLEEDEKAAFTSDINIPLFVEQYFQHNPQRVKQIPTEVNFSSEDETEFFVNLEQVNPIDWLYALPDQTKVPVPYVAKFDQIQRKFKLYKFKEAVNENYIYSQIDLLGSYNLDEYNADVNTTTPSLLKNNQVVVKNPLQVLNQPSTKPSLPTESVITTIINNLPVKLEKELFAQYNFNKELTGDENVLNILQSISSRSKNPLFKSISSLLLDINSKTPFIQGLSFTISKEENQYNAQTKTINLSYEEFANNPDLLQYSFLHELLHVFSVEQLLSDSEAGRQFNVRINKLINTLKTPENLKKAINLFNLTQKDGSPTTPEYLLSQLLNPTFSTEIERSLLNGLKNPFEFVSTILTDEKFQQWTNEVEYQDYETPKKSLLSSFKEFIYKLIDKLSRVLNITIKDKSVLKEGLEVSLDILYKPTQEAINNKGVKPEDFTNHSGGAYGGDTFWDIIGRTFGFTNNKHYRDAGNISLSKQLRDKGIKAEVLSKEQMDKARTEVENLLGKKYPDTLQGNLQVRNYYQVANSDGVFAIAKLDTDKGFKSTSVLGGTNTAVQLGIKLNKPVYVWDIFSEKWYKFDTNLKQFEFTETPVLTKNFAGVGSRDVENYQTKNKETGNWESRKEYIGKEKEEKAKQAIKDVYQKTLGKSNQGVQQSLFKLAKIEENPEERKELEKEKFIDYIDQKTKQLKANLTAINRDKKLTEEQKLDKIERLKLLLSKLGDVKFDEKEYSIADFSKMGYFDIAIVENMLSKDSFTTEEALFAMTTLEFYQRLYSDMLSTERGYGEDIDFELKDLLNDLKSRISFFQAQINEIAGNQFIGEYSYRTGKTTSMEQLLSVTDKTVLGYRNNYVNLMMNRNNLARTMGDVIYNMNRDIADNKREHQAQDEKELNKFLSKFTFDDIRSIETFTDEKGIERTTSNFLSRNTLQYNLTFKNIFKTADNRRLFPNTPEGRQKKSKYIQDEIQRVSYTIDLRYLFSQEYNDEFTGYSITEEQSNKYKEELKQFFIKEFEELGEEYAIKRYNEVIRQTEERYKSYQEDKEIYLQTLEDEENEAIKQIKLRDWYALNSPFVLLNERIGFNGTKAGVAKTSKTIVVKTAQGEKEVQAYVDWKERNSKNYLTNKAKRKDGDNLTGFYNEKFLQDEKEEFEKLDRIAELGLDTPEAQALINDPTKFEFLQWAIERQKYYLSKLPRYLTEDIRYNTIIDTKQDIGEKFQEVFTEMKAFNLLSVAPLVNLSINFVWDRVVKSVSERTIDETNERIDYLSGQVKRYFTPNISSKLNEEGIADLKTNDLRRYFEILRSSSVEYEGKSQTESLIKIGQYVFKKASGGSAEFKFTMDGKDVSQEEELETVNWAVDNKLYGVKDYRDNWEKKVLSTSDTKIFGVLTPRLKLTKDERDEIVRLEEKIAYLQNELKNTKLPKENQYDYFAEITKSQNRIDKIKREVNVVSSLNSSVDFLRLKFLGFATFGRIVDFTYSGIIGNLQESIDGRIFSFQDYSKALSIVIPTYGLKTTGDILTVAGVLSLNPGFVASGLSLRAAGSVANQTILKKHQAKITQLLWRFGALDNFHHLSDENIDNFVLNKSVSKELKEATKLLSPYSLLEQTEVVNKGISTIATINAIKIKDKNNKERPLLDAYIVDDDLNLIWNEEEFLSQEELGYDFITGENYKQARSKVVVATRNVNGDYDSSTTLKADAKSYKRIAMFLRRFMGELIQRRFSSEFQDEETGISYKGRYRALVTAPFDRNPSQAQKAAFRQGLTEIALLISLGLVLQNVLEHLISMLDSDDDDIVEFTEILYFIANANTRIVNDMTQFYNVDVFQQRSYTGLHPFLSFTFQTADFLLAFAQALTKEEGDKMTKREMISNGLLKPNEIVREKYNPKTGKITTYYFDPYAKNKVSPKNKYPKTYPAQSRIMFKAAKLLPITSVSSSTKKNLDKKK